MHGNYSGQYAQTNCRNVILVEATGQTTEFAKPGDSGSLVVQRCTRDGPVQTAIGIVHKHWKNWTDSCHNDHDVTVVVPLKSGFNAIEAEFGIKLQLCAKWEKCRIQQFNMNV